MSVVYPMAPAEPAPSPTKNGEAYSHHDPHGVSVLVGIVNNHSFALAALEKRVVALEATVAELTQANAELRAQLAHGSRPRIFGGK